MLRAVLATALYITLSGLFSFGLGAMLRSTAGTLTAAYALLFLLPQLAKALPSQWYADLVRWLPGGDVDKRNYFYRTPAPAASVHRLGRVCGVRRLHGHHPRRGCAAAAPP